MGDPQNNSDPMPISRGLPQPAAPPPLIERLKKEVIEASRVGSSNIYYYFGQSHLIGRGGSSMVFKGYHQLPEKKAAVKLVKYDEFDTSELEVWNKLHSNNHSALKYIVSIFQHTIENNILYIAMEMASGNLEQELIYHTTQPHEYPLRFSYLRNIFTGLEYLHGNNIIHRDIKPQNIFIFENTETGEKTAKLGDFGLSRCLSQTEGSISIGKGTEIWMSPEALRAYDDEMEFMNTKAMDIFSFGLVCAYTLCNRQHPFNQNDKLKVNIKDAEVGPDLYYIHNSQKYRAAEHLILWMLQKDPSRRPTTQQCRAHPFFWENENEKFIEFLSDLEKAIRPTKDDQDEEESWNQFQNILDGIHESVTRHYILRKNKSPNSFEIGFTWTWEPLVDPILLERRDAGNTMTIYKFGYSVWSLINFINDKVENPQNFVEGAVQKHFSDDGTDENFSRKTFAKYFMDLFPEMLPLVFFTLARMLPKFSRLRGMEEKYYKEMVGCHENWNIGIMAACMERLCNKLEL